MIPATVSEEARRYLAALAPPPAWPKDVEGWHAMKTRTNAAMDGLARAVLEKSPLQPELIELGGAPVHHVRPVAPELVALDFHSGSLVFGEGLWAAASAVVTARRLNAVTYGVDYRTPPEHPFPAALDDCLQVYRAIAPMQPLMVGNSAGANLALATALRAKAEGLMPRGLILLWPQIDLTESGDTFLTNAAHDLAGGSTMACNLIYADDRSDPLVSPLFGDFAGFPPTLIISGTRDIMLSNAVRLHRSMRRVGVKADLCVWEGAPHGGLGSKAIETDEMAWEMARFAAKLL